LLEHIVTTADLGQGEPWSLKSIAERARTFQEEILPNASLRKNPPAGLHGVKFPSMFSIPVHLWVSPILHGERGLVKDWLTRMENVTKMNLVMKVSLLEL
jgi:hypothetical protein